MTTPFTYRPCPACDTTQASIIAAYWPDEWDVASCDECDLVFLRNPPDYAALAEDYAWEKTYIQKKATGGSTVFSPVGRWLKENTSFFRRNRDDQMRDWFNNGHVLDIGCGSGLLVPEPMTPFGIELSTALHATADSNMRARGGYCVHGAGATAIWEFDENQFDGIIMNSYLEHEIDALTVLKGAARALKPSGKLFVRVPNFASLNRRVIGKKWCGFRYPDHISPLHPCAHSSPRRVSRCRLPII